MALAWRYKALIVLGYFLANIFQTSALKQLSGESHAILPKSNRTIKSSVGSSCTSYYDCDDGLYCYDGYFSDQCTSCTDSSDPCSSYNSIDNLCCPGSSSSSTSSSYDFSWATSILSLFFPGYNFSINDGCGWTSADLNKNLYYGNCGDSIFLENASDGWCTVTYSNSWVGDSGSIGLCLANSEADCCEVAPGPTAGIAIALILLLSGIITCICRCCRCFCFKSKAEAPQVVVVQAPANPVVVQAPAATASEK